MAAGRQCIGSQFCSNLLVGLTVQALLLAASKLALRVLSTVTYRQALQIMQQPCAGISHVVPLLLTLMGDCAAATIIIMLPDQPIASR
jgi:hypothetical protein